MEDHAPHSVNGAPAARAGLVAALLAALAAGGRATLSEDECRSADWNQIGRRDGLRGSPAARLEEHIGACSKLGIRPDAAQYTAGRTDRKSTRLNSSH